MCGIWLIITKYEDLINIATDIDERVIFDEDASLYFIIHDNFLYLYETDK
ncbi:MAG: DUF5305 family protein [archaeon]|nr:DUF5305 family protein [archaeon]